MVLILRDILGMSNGWIKTTELFPSFVKSQRRVELQQPELDSARDNRGVIWCEHLVRIRLVWWNAIQRFAQMVRGS